MSEYNSNSNKKIKQVTTGKQLNDKKSVAVNTVKKGGSFVMDELVLPMVKRTTHDIITNILDVLSGTVDTLFGVPRQKSRSGYNRERVSYFKYYDTDDRMTRNYRSGILGANDRLDDILIPTRGEAEDVLDCLQDIINKYDSVSIADYKELVGVDTSFTDNKYGWTNIRNAQVKRCRDGYVIKMPRALPLD